MAFIINLLFDEEKIFLFLSFHLRLPVLNFTKITYNPAAASASHNQSVPTDSSHSLIRLFILLLRRPQRIGTEHEKGRRTNTRKRNRTFSVKRSKRNEQMSFHARRIEWRMENKSVVCGATGRLVDGVPNWVSFTIGTIVYHA